MDNLKRHYYGHLMPYEIDSKDKLLHVIDSIDYSFVGRADMLGLHQFFSESAIMLKNSLKLYEEGIFDAALYSVREAIELARIVTLFSEQDDPKSNEYISEWRKQGHFPFDGAIRDKLITSSGVYNEVHDMLKDFFAKQFMRSRKVQKYIHKQGYKTFYIQRSSFPKNNFEPIENIFENYIKNAIKEILIYRLCVDPFPVMLQDKRVRYKIHSQPITEPFSQSTIDFLGPEIIKKYQTTEYYKSIFEFFDKNESLNEPTYNLVYDQYYSHSAWPQIKKQFHLISSTDRLAAKLFHFSDKIAKVYFHRGILWYFSDIKSKNSPTIGFDSRAFDTAKEKNVEYDKAFLSYFGCTKEKLWIEHNVKLTNEEIMVIIRLVCGEMESPPQDS